MGYYYNPSCSTQLCSQNCCNFQGTCPDPNSTQTLAQTCQHYYKYYSNNGCKYPNTNTCCFQDNQGLYDCQSNTNNSTNFNIIVGAVIGSIIVIIIIVAIVVYCWKRRKNRKQRKLLPGNNGFVGQNNINSNNNIEQNHITSDNIVIVGDYGNTTITAIGGGGQHSVNQISMINISPKINLDQYQQSSPQFNIQPYQTKQRLKQPHRIKNKTLRKHSQPYQPRPHEQQKHINQTQQDLHAYTYINNIIIKQQPQKMPQGDIEKMFVRTVKKGVRKSTH